MLLFFSDETEAFRSPAEPEPGQNVSVRLRVEKNVPVRVRLWVDRELSGYLAKRRSDKLFDWYEGTIACDEAMRSYCFIVEYADRVIACQSGGARWVNEENPLDPRFNFRIMPGFHVPHWAKGALQYQIFTDRFRNGDKSNDVRAGEYAYGDSHIKHAKHWRALPGTDDYRCFYGGDLQGVISQLDYLQSLGVEVIYFNPLFLSPSSHKYDTQDYWHIDPHFGIIEEDADSPLAEGDLDNAHAHQYITRVTSEKNLARTDELFAELCNEIHRRGMRMILDGVFNHCGSFSRWMDREGIYEGRGEAPGAYRSENSPYRSYFKFDDVYMEGYEAWWGVETLPKLYYEASIELRKEIADIVLHWMSEPYSIDGWRLDVAADVGHSDEYNHKFWRNFRRLVKGANPDAVIIAEHYGSPARWLRGDQWDTVMNYDAFMDPLSFFLTGMEKHSDFAREDLYQDGEAFIRSMRDRSSRIGWISLQCAMNELSNHDHSRFMTRTNKTVGRLETHGSKAAKEGIDKRVFREAVMVQMTWPGAPTIYYGDEAGLVGWTDPDNRRTFPWGHEDWSLVELHRTLSKVRKEHLALKYGSLVLLGGGTGWMAFGRFFGSDRLVTVCNNEEWEQTVFLRVRMLGIEDGSEIVERMRTTDDAQSESPMKAVQVSGGIARVTVPARTAMLLMESR